MAAAAAAAEEDEEEELDEVEEAVAASERLLLVRRGIPNRRPAGIESGARKTLCRSAGPRYMKEVKSFQPDLFCDSHPRSPRQNFDVVFRFFRGVDIT